MPAPDQITIHRATAGERVAPAPGLFVVYPSGEMTLFCPLCGKGAGLSNHTVEFDSDNTVTFSPSVICPGEKCKAHYYVRKNRIEYV